MKFENDSRTTNAHYLNLEFSQNFLGELDSKITIDLPYPISRPLKDSNCDVIAKYNEDLETYMNNLSNYRAEFQTVKEKIINQTFTKSHATISKGLFDLCNGERPKTPFTCDFNPYYTTGLLECITLNDINYLIRPDCRNNLRISKLTKPWKCKKLPLEVPLEQNITGITQSDQNFLLLKLDNQIMISKPPQTVFTKNFKLPLLDSKLNNGQLGVVLANLKFKLYDVEMDKKIDLEAYDCTPILCDFIHPNNVALLGQKCLKIIDQRSNDQRTFDPNLSPCNSLCSMKFKDDAIYLGSQHHLIRTDVRFLKNMEYCTHMMKCAPCYMELNDDFLCLSSQKDGEKVLFKGTPVGSLPIGVPSIKNGLNQCRLKRDILLKDGLDDRLQKSVGGIKLISEGNDVFLYSVNSSGDIFKQKVTGRGLNSESESIDFFYFWINKLPEEPKQLYLTDAVNMSRARFCLNESSDPRSFVKFKRPRKKLTFFLNHFNKKYHKKELGEHAQAFASIWEDEEEVELEEEVDLVPEVAPKDKVTSWIESSYFFDEDLA